MLTLRYICAPRRRRGSGQEIGEDILDALATQDDIDFAYPIPRFYRNDTDGKPGSRPEAIYTSESTEQNEKQVPNS